MQPPLFHRPSFPIIFLLSFLVSQVSCMCYAANGSAVWNWGPESIYQPCSNDSSNPLSTICCATNRANPPGGSISDGFTADICLPSGLCQNILTDEDGTVLYAYWRDYCTISQWTKDKCLKVCTGDGQHSADGTAPLTPCGDTLNATKWCCGTNNTDCCSSDDPTEEMAIPVSLGGTISSTSTSATPSPTSSATSISTSVSTSTFTSQPASSSSSNNNKDSSSSSLSSGAKAGIGVGAAVGGALVIAVIILAILYSRKRKEGEVRKKNPYELPSQTGYVEAPPGYQGSGYYGQHGVSEAAGTELNEMSTESAVEGKATKYRHDGVKGEERRGPAELA